MRFASCITKAADTHSGYVILFAFQWHRGYVNAVQYYVYTYVACLVKIGTGCRQLESIIYRRRFATLEWNPPEYFELGADGAHSCDGAVEGGKMCAYREQSHKLLEA